jgi:hypothetical protein
VSEQISVNIECPNPECKTQKTVKVPSYLFDNKKVGLIKIQIHKGVCCDHQFVVFLDKKGAVRGYENIDIQIDLTAFANRSVGAQIFLKDILNQYKQFAVANMLHALIIGSPIKVLVRNEDNSKGMNTLFNSYLPDNKKQPFIIQSIPEKDFKKAKIEDDLVINPEGYIAAMPWQDIAMNYESGLIQKALDILDDESQAIIIQGELETLFAKAQFIADLIKKEKQIYEDDLKEMINKQFPGSNCSDYDILLLKRIVGKRYKGDIARIKIRSFDKLKEGLW